jgi:hypothetical protein
MLLAGAATLPMLASSALAASDTPLKQKNALKIKAQDKGSSAPLKVKNATIKSSAAPLKNSSAPLKSTGAPLKDSTKPQ